MPSMLALTALVGLCLILLISWTREHRALARQDTVRALNELAEGILPSATPSECLRRLAEVIPGVLGATGVRLYLYNYMTRRLDRVPAPDDPSPLAIHPDRPNAGLAAGVALTFRNRTPLSVPDTRRSPLFPPDARSGLPRSILCVPMIAQDEVMGVLELYNQEGAGGFSPQEQAQVQHLANQVAASLKFDERQSMREQLFRGEKLAASARVISNVASQLAAPIGNILALSKKLMGERESAGLAPELGLLAAEAQRSSEIVRRLVSFGQAEASETEPVEMNGLLSGLIRFREREWKGHGITGRSNLSEGALYTSGVRAQLEQLLLNVLMYVEQSVSEAPARTLQVSTRAAGGHILIEMEYGCPEGATDPFLDGNAGDAAEPTLAVWRNIVDSHGGQTRFSHPGPDTCRLEIELPLAAAARTPDAPVEGRPARTLTTLVIEPEASWRGRLVRDLSARGHRVVPVSSGEEGIDLAQRMRFDAVFCSTRLAGASWMEYYDRIHGTTGAFVPMTEGFELDSGPMREWFLLHKPSYDLELDTVLVDVEALLMGDKARCERRA